MIYIPINPINDQNTIVWFSTAQELLRYPAITRFFVSTGNSKSSLAGAYSKTELNVKVDLSAVSSSNWRQLNDKYRNAKSSDSFERNLIMCPCLYKRFFL